MKYYTPEKAYELLLEEYPILRDAHVTIIKQFSATDGRPFNTFLVESEKNGFRKFIAKGQVVHKYTLEGERKILQLLNKRNADAPRLLMPDHPVKHLLLLEFVEGISAAEMFKRGEEVRGEVFSEIGNAVGKLHMTPATHFGDLEKGNGISWGEYLTSKIIERLEGGKDLTGDLYDEAKRLFESLKEVIRSESEGEPVLIHRDIYFENFILQKGTSKAILLDYGMAIGGRPLYDLAKFYILELYKQPQYRDSFLTSYSKYISLPDDFSARMTLYILKEALGMINFFNEIGDFTHRDHAFLVLKQLARREGKIVDLIEK